MMCENRGSQRAKKEPRHFCRSSFAAPRTPLRVDAEAPGQAPHNQSSTDGWKCQAFAPNIAQRQGQGRSQRVALRPPGLTLARSRYNGRAHGLTAPRGGAAKQRGHSPLPPGTALPRSPQRGRRGREGRGGEAKGQHGDYSDRTTDDSECKRAKHARSEKGAGGEAEGTAAPPPRPPATERSPPKPRRGRRRGEPATAARNRRRPRGQQGRPTREPTANRGEARGTAAAASGSRGRSPQSSPSAKAGGSRAGERSGRARPERARAARRSRSGTEAREVAKKRERRPATQREAGQRPQARIPLCVATEGSGSVRAGCGGFAPAGPRPAALRGTEPPRALCAGRQARGAAAP